ncbi:MAG: hypothetical protein V4733_08700 [Verrucomicrobiota bacterium]
MKRLLPFFLLLLVFTLSSVAQEGGDQQDKNDGKANKPPAEEVDKPEPNRFWQAKLSGGHYMVQLDRISSISRHSYLLDGTVLVDEVSIDALGQTLARFYQLSPFTDAAGGTNAADVASRAIERGREVVEGTAQRFGSRATEMVVKKYPETTHARTVEFRIETAEQLTRLYNSVKTAWESGRGRSFTMK